MKRRTFFRAFLALPLAPLALKETDPVLRLPRLRGREELRKKLRTVKPSGTYIVFGDLHYGTHPAITADFESSRLARLAFSGNHELVATGKPSS